MNAAPLFLSAALVTVTCLVHSVLGERKLIGPLLQMRNGVLQRDLARQVLRFAWHFMSVLGLIVALVLFSGARDPSDFDPMPVLVIGLLLTGSGLADAIYTKGRHVGWPLIVASGLAALAALY